MYPSRLSIWRIAAGVFIGNILCMLISFVLYGCLWLSLMVLGTSPSRLLR